MLALPQLYLIGLTYLVILFGSAYAAERGWIPRTVSGHPAVRVLALGVFAGTLAFYGAIGFAAEYGESYLLFFLGGSAMFLMAPVLLGPIGRVASEHKLGSLADVFAFRYPSPWVGGTISVLLLIGTLPLLSLQIHAVAATVHLFNQALTEEILAMIFCLNMMVFAILFGARHLSTRDKHEGLVFAICLESLIKLIALAVLASYCTFVVFEGPAAMLTWVEGALTFEDLGGGASRSILILFFGAAICLPHVYHLLIAENNDPATITRARWGMPAYLMLFSLCLPPVLFSAAYLAIPVAPELAAPAIGLAVNKPVLSVIAFVACLAASSGVLIVSTLALASMTLNHALLPLYRPKQGVDIYLRLLNTRRVLIAAIIIASYLVYQVLRDEQNLMSLGFVALVAAVQFLPGLVFGFHWRRANRHGLLAGLAAGFLVWLATLMIPFIQHLLIGVTFELDTGAWHNATVASLFINIAVFVLVSLLTETDEEETVAAAACLSDSPTPYGELEASSVHEIEQNLARALGQTTSNREVMLALDELRFEPTENRPHALSLLREQMETNLASMLGQTIAHRIIARVLPLKHSGSPMHVMEGFLESYRSELTGLAAQLDHLRLYHRQLLQDLPTAVCSVDRDLQVRTWNQAMEAMTGITAQRAFGAGIGTLPDPWQELFGTFLFDSATNRLKVEVRTGPESRWVNLHKASTVGYNTLAQDEVVIVVEDVTESQVMESQLIHKERLASIGQLAAGVAHEIGNPVTGIACLAQNLKLEPETPETMETANEILNQTERISAILQSLVNFAYGTGDDVERASVAVNLQQCVDEAIKLLSLSKRDSEVRLENRCPNELTTTGDPQRLCQVFVTLLANAQDASAPGATVLVEAGNLDDTIVIHITDQGEGIPGDQVNRIFDPFYTTKDPDKGTGLGLAIVTTIVNEHHGEISVERVSDAGGTRVILRLPHHGAPELTSAPQSLLIR